MLLELRGSTTEHQAGIVFIGHVGQTSSLNHSDRPSHSLLAMALALPAVAELQNELSNSLQLLSFLELLSSAQWAAELLAALPPGPAPAPLSLGPDWAALMLAKAHMGMREYARAASVLPKELTTPCALFFRCYALYLAGEKRKDEEIAEIQDPVEKCQVKNQELRLGSRDVFNGFEVF